MEQHQPDDIYQFEFTMYEVMLLKQFIDRALLNWPGGDPDEQTFLSSLQMGLRSCVLEHTFTLESDNK